MDLRSNTINRDFFGSIYSEQSEFIRTNKLPLGRLAIGRMLHLCRKEPGYHTVPKKDACLIVAREFTNDWVSKNIYPSSDRTVSQKILADFERFNDIRKALNRDRKKSDEWFANAMAFHEKLTIRAYDIKSENPDFERDLVAKYGVRMTEDDRAFYRDNCHGDYIAICTDQVPRKWFKNEIRKESRSQSESEKISKLNEEKVKLLLEKNAAITQTISDTIHDDTSDETYQCGNVDSADISSSRNEPWYCPPLELRTGRKTFNESVMRTMVQALADTNISPSDLLKLFQSIGNGVFGQKWALSADTEEDDEAEETEAEADLAESTKKRRKRDLTFVLPSRRTLRQYLEDASYINLEMLAEKLKNKQEKVVTLGVDDTSKAAGHRKIDVKTTHLTIIDPDTKKKETFTTGFTPNASHSGKDSALAIEYELKRLAVLGGVSHEEIAMMIDFVMTDRAADNDVMMAELNLDAGKLKCSGHIVLGVDHAIEKVFIDTETKIGVEKLIDSGKILQSSSSIFTLGLLAITKLLSPSHANHTISLYNCFMDWCEQNGRTEVSGFRGFVANRFGRVSELATQFLRLKSTIQDFFDSVVDENSNKLVLAVSTFTENAWFSCCCEVYSLLGQIVINPILQILGIDGKGDHERKTWVDLVSFFKVKIVELKRRREDFSHTKTGKGQLITVVLAEVIVAVERQLSSMSIFEENSDAIPEKMIYTPLTNLGCESNFAVLDNQIKKSGGMTSVKTHSMKAIVSRNRFLLDSKLDQQSEEERHNMWKRARSSENVKLAKKLEADFLKTVKAAQILSLKRKQELKKKKVVKVLETLKSCKRHGGPVTEDSVHILDDLTEKQLLLETCYLRYTVSPDIRQKRRVLVDGRYRYQTFTKAELKRSIMSVVKPVVDVTEDIETLLKSVLKQQAEE